MFRILVVEDDADLRGLFCRTLEKNDFIALQPKTRTGHSKYSIPNT